MKVYISMIRGINVGGQKKIKMADLKLLYESLDFQNVRTYIQSGNVIFEYTDTNLSILAKIVEEKILHTFDFHVTVFMKTIEDLKEIAKNNPFLNDRKEDINKLHVTFLSHKPNQSSIDEIVNYECRPDEFYLNCKEIYLFCPNGYGRTKLSNNFFESKLNLSTTTRNWKTINKLIDIASNNSSNNI